LKWNEKFWIDIYAGNSLLPDIVLNTHVLKFLLKDEFLEKILEKKVHVFAAKCAYYKEFRAKYASFVSILEKNAKKISPFFHCKDAASDKLPPHDLKKALQKEGASTCDIQIAALACDRNRSGNDVILVSNDPHFRNLRECIERHGVQLRSSDDFQSKQW